MKPIDINELSLQVLKVLRSDAITRGCEIELQLSENLPSVTGDFTQLQQVLINLLMNSFDALQELPSKERRVVLSSTENPAGRIRLQVRDYGSGLPGKGEQIFEQFYSTKKDGLGMGLSIARSIVEHHGGKLTIETIDGPGACFSLNLPANA